MTMRRRVPVKSRLDTMTDCATETFCIIVTEPAGTPSKGASRSPVVRLVCHQPSDHARTPRVSHASRNRLACERASRGIAPSE